MSNILNSVLSMAKNLKDCGAISDTEMNEYYELCKSPTRSYSVTVYPIRVMDFRKYTTLVVAFSHTHAISLTREYHQEVFSPRPALIVAKYQSSSTNE